MTTLGADLRVANLTVSFPLPDGGRVDAVRDASFCVGGGEIRALLGASGSGKSTVLRAIAGLERPTAGRIVVDGDDVTSLPTHQRGVGMVFQRGELFPHRSVAKNIAFGLEIAKWDSQAKTERVAELLDLVGLSGFEDRPIDTLSGGQAQRVSLARSLAPHPRVLLLDEPLSALDRTLRERLTREIRRILKAEQTTAIYVTHDREEAGVVADSVMVIDDGELRV